MSRSRGLNRFVVIGVVGLALVVLSIITFVLLRVGGTVTQRVRSRVGTALPPLSLDTLGGWKSTERVTVLLLGIDQRPNENPDTARTDTMILLTLDPQTKTAGILSIPRDLYVPLPDRGQDRINTAHVFGGSQLAMRTVEYNFGIPVQHYARVNFTALITLIDLVGGIDIYNEKDIDDPLFPNDSYGYDPFKLSKGWHKLDGKTALKYARTRHGDSDFYRIRRQQQVIMALREKFVSSDAITKVLPNAPQILQTLEDAIVTDLSSVEIAQLALLAKDIPSEKIARVVIDESAVLPYTTPQGAQVEVPNRERLRVLREEFLNPISTAATPETGRIAIQNGTQTRGLAAGAKTFLEGKGFVVAEIGDAQEATTKTVIVDYKGKRRFVESLAATLGLDGTAVVTAINPNASLDALLILGDDYQQK